MAEISSDYQNDVGFIQGGTGMYIKDTATFKFYDTDITGLQLRNALAIIVNGEFDILLSGGGTNVNNSRVADSCINLRSDYKYYKMSLTSGAVSPSFYLTSCVLGQEAYIRCVQGSLVNNGTLTLLTSGCSIAYYSAGVTSLLLSDATGSAPFVHLKCFSDGQWTVLETRGVVNY